MKSYIKESHAPITAGELNIKGKFRNLLPPLTDEQRESLSESINTSGIYNSLVGWNDGHDWWLVDGHNRWECFLRILKDDQSFVEPGVLELVADSEEDVMAWIIQEHITRRNLTPNQLSELRGRLYNEMKLDPKDNLNPPIGQIDPSRKQGKNGQKPKKPNADEIGEQFGVSGSTIKRDGNFAKGMEQLEKADPDEAEKVRHGKSVAFTKADIERKGRGESGEPTPDKAIKELRKPFNGMVSKLGEIRENFISHSESPGGEFIDDIAKQEIRTAIGRAQEIVKSRSPVLHKPCKGEGCETCENMGYTRKG